MGKLIAIALFLLFMANAFAESPKTQLKTNGIIMNDAPKWVTVNRIDKVVNRIQSLLEWSIRRIDVQYYQDEERYAQVNKLGPSAIAFAMRANDSVHLGPRVTDQN